MSAPIESGLPPARRWSAIRSLAPIRLVVFFFALLAADVGAQLARIWAFRHVPPQDADWAALGTALVLAMALIGIYTALVRGMERRGAAELAPAPGGAAIGVLFGIVLFGAVLGLLLLTGAAQMHGLAANIDVIPVLAASIVAAVGEELAFRGGLFRVLEDGCGTTVALALSAALFGLVHALNPGATVVSTAAIAVEAGILLGAAYALTRNLWLPIGLHFGWNFTEGGLFGVAVSGGTTAKGVFSVTLAGPRWLTGGSFGPEASVVAVAVCFAAALVLIAVAVRKGRWRPLRWRMVLE